MSSRPEAARRLTPTTALLLVGLGAALAVALTEIYALTTRVVGGEGWLGAAVAHTVLALVVLGVMERRGDLRAAWSLTTVDAAAPAWLRRRPFLAYLPAAAVLGGAALLVVLSTMAGGASRRGEAASHLAWIVWVPVVEEIVFRAGIGRALRGLAGPLWGAWFSALVFALAHAAPTVGRFLSLEVGLPLGPFLLGLACEALYGTTRRLVPAIALHAACNATVVVFALGDERWLDWLGYLYR